MLPLRTERVSRRPLTDADDQYMVIDSAGVQRELRRVDRDRAELIRDIIDGQHDDIFRIVKFNLREGKCSDATQDIAERVYDEALAQLRPEPIPSHLHEFLSAWVPDFDAVHEEQREQHYASI